jgi:ribosomal protein S14
MAGQTTCPRCGARDSFIKGYLPETCVCRVCLSQLDWREIPGCGPDCSAAEPDASAGGKPAAGSGSVDA